MASIKQTMKRQRRRLAARRYQLLDRLYLPLDKARTKRASNLRWVPDLEHRIGGKVSYGEWCHVIGVFQALIGMHVGKPSGNRVVDVGCGTGILAIASAPFVADGGGYTGIDVGLAEIEFDRRHYPASTYTFVHSDDHNEAYTSSTGHVSWSNAPSAGGDAAPATPVDNEPAGAPAPGARSPWPIADASTDLVTALSVWTHFNQDDALHYTREVNRILRPGGRAIITMFLLDDAFDEAFNAASTRLGDLQFSEPCSPSGLWLTPSWTRVPEDVVGLRPAGLDLLLDGTDLKQIEVQPGSWKRAAGVYFQDVTVLEKRA